MAEKDRAEADILKAVTQAQIDRRKFIGTSTAVLAGASLLSADNAYADTAQNLAASPPAGFTPFSAPGRIVKVKKAGSLQANGVYPKPDDAKEMLTRVLT
ncbi:MAG: hypothetical protein ACREJX_10375, partial [Polyangiaceae bacterium]